jgi:hypothetical protein
MGRAYVEPTGAVNFTLTQPTRVPSQSTSGASIPYVGVTALPKDGAFAMSLRILDHDEIVPPFRPGQS